MKYYNFGFWIESVALKTRQRNFYTLSNFYLDFFTKRRKKNLTEKNLLEIESGHYLVLSNVSSFLISFLQKLKNGRSFSIHFWTSFRFASQQCRSLSVAFNLECAWVDQRLLGNSVPCWHGFGSLHCQKVMYSIALFYQHRDSNLLDPVILDHTSCTFHTDLLGPFWPLLAPIGMLGQTSTCSQ